MGECGSQWAAMNSIAAKVGCTAESLRKWVTKRQDLHKRLARVKRDEALCVDVKCVFDGNYGVCGAKKVWRRMNQEDIRLARCTVERVVKQPGLKGRQPAHLRHPPLDDQMDENIALRHGMAAQGAQEIPVGRDPLNTCVPEAVNPTTPESAPWHRVGPQASLEDLAGHKQR